MFILWFNMGVDQGAAAIGGTLLNMAVFAAMFSCIMQVLFFILLRRKLPRLERPYRSPFGILGASLTILIATVTVYYQLTGLIYRQGVLWMGGWLVCGEYPFLHSYRSPPINSVTRRRVRFRAQQSAGLITHHQSVF